MRAMITGGSGYLGSHLCKQLHKEGWTIAVLDIKVPQHRYFDNCYIVDICEANSLREKLELFQPDVVFHLAGRIEVGDSQRDPDAFWKTNFNGTNNLIGAMKAVGTKMLVFSSTAAVYGSSDEELTETSLIKPSSVYGETKLACEHLIAESGLRSVVFRFFNLAGASEDGEIGENHHPETHIIARALMEHHLSVFGGDYDTPDGTCIRDYVHVVDVAKAHVNAVQYMLDGGQSQVFNLGSGCGTSVLEVIKEVQRHVQIDYIITDRREGDPARLVASIDKAKELLGFDPVYSLQDIVYTAHKWHTPL